MLQCGKANPKPLVFALLTNGDKFIQVAHGFGTMALDSDEHHYNRNLGCFIGACWVMEIQVAHVLQDPTFVTMPADMAEPFISIKMASDGIIKKMGENDTLRAGNPKSATVTILYFLPLPLGWVHYFMKQRRSGKEAYACLLYTSPSPRDGLLSRMPSSA